jgi:lysozyme
MNINYNPIRIHEGLRLKPYLCPAKIPTIGYGNTFYENGKKVTLSDPAITKEKAEQLMRWYVLTYVVPTIKKNVRVELNENQLGAIVSFIYNLGPGAFTGSTLLKKINANPLDPAIRTEFGKWINSNGKPNNGLIKRRKSEADLYFTPVSK